MDACLTAAALSNIFTQDLESREEVKELNGADDNGAKDTAALILDFGRHRGKTLGYVYKNDHGYIKWLFINAVDETIKSAAGRMLKDDELG